MHRRVQTMREALTQDHLPYIGKLNIKKVEQVQPSSARFVTGNYDPRSSVTSRLKVLKWPTLENRPLQTRLAMLYHIRFDLVDIQWSDYLTEAQSRTRGHQSRFWTHTATHICMHLLSSLAQAATGTTWYKILQTNHPSAPPKQP